MEEDIGKQFMDAVSSARNLEDILANIITCAALSEENQLILGRDQTLVVQLLDSLSRPPYEQNHDVCDLIFQALIRLCRRTMDKSTTCTVNCDIVLQDRGGKRILDALANFILERNHIIGTACQLIMVLAADSSERQCLLAEEGVSVALAAVLFQYSTDDYAAEMGARAVRNLATNDDVAGALISEGVGEALVKVLKENQSLTVLEQSLWAIVNLSCNGQIATILGSAGVFDAIYRIMDIHCSHAQLIEASASAMRNLLAESEMNMSQIVKCKESLPISSLLVRCLSIHQENQSVCEVLFWASANLASCSELGSVLYDDGILPIILATYHQSNGTRNFDLKAAVTWTLRNIVNSVPQHVSEIMNTGLVNYVIETISHPDLRTDSLLYISLDVLRSILSHWDQGLDAASIIESFIDPLLLTISSVTSSSSVQVVHTCLLITSRLISLRKGSPSVTRLVDEIKLWIDSDAMHSLSAQDDRIRSEIDSIKGSIEVL